MSTLLIDKAGIQTTIQDLGRPGLGRYGIPAGGAMDRFALMVGNLMLGNRPDCAALETLLHGLKIKALDRVALAITGGNLTPYLNDRPVEMWTTFHMNPGDVLYFQKSGVGFRAYVCIMGGIDAPVYLGSRSVYPQGKMGRILKQKDRIKAFHPAETSSRQPVKLPAEFLPDYDLKRPIQVIAGPQTDHFSARGMETFLTSAYTITPKLSRQAICPTGPAIEHCKDPSIITDPTPQGSIQVPGDGQPIILLRDAQVTGGYAKIGIVTRTDLDRLAQAKPGDRIHFHFIDPAEGMNLWNHCRRKLNQLAAMLGREACAQYY